jgi:hypothetical protein
MVHIVFSSVNLLIQWKTKGECIMLICIAVFSSSVMDFQEIQILKGRTILVSIEKFPDNDSNQESK